MPRAWLVGSSQTNRPTARYPEKLELGFGIGRLGLVLGNESATSLQIAYKISCLLSRSPTDADFHTVPTIKLSKAGWTQPSSSPRLIKSGESENDAWHQEANLPSPYHDPGIRQARTSHPSQESSLYPTFSANNGFRPVWGAAQTLLYYR